MVTQHKRIIIMAGGTGGHIFPALAVANHLRDLQWDVSWIGTQQGMESRVIPAHNIEIDWLSVAGIRGKGLVEKLKNVTKLLKSFWQIFKIFRKRKPNVVLGMGGYVAGPGGMIASLMGIPLVIHEQNRVPGTTNKLLVKRANKVLEAFPRSFSGEVKAIFTGNPVRTEFLNLKKKGYWSPESKRNFRILIIGGSLGAQVLNEVVPNTLAKLENIDIKHQTGKVSCQLVTDKYAELLVNAESLAFIDDVAEAYEWADMIICRAGAMTISEISVAGLPAVLIPLPHAIDDHQTANAKYLTEAGAGILLAQHEFNEQSLLMAINEIQGSLEKMSIAALSKAKQDATEVVANVCINEAV